MFYLKHNPKFFYTEKKIFLWKCISVSILQKPKVTNNSITMLSYSNDKNIYTAKNIISTG